MRLAKANRFEDVFLLYTPFGYQATTTIRTARSRPPGAWACWSPAADQSQPGEHRPRAGQRHPDEDPALRAGTAGHRRSGARGAGIRIHAHGRPPGRADDPAPRPTLADARYRLFTEGQENLITYLDPADLSGRSPPVSRLPDPPPPKHAPAQHRRGTEDPALIQWSTRLVVGGLAATIAGAVWFLGADRITPTNQNP